MAIVPVFHRHTGFRICSVRYPIRAACRERPLWRSVRAKRLRKQKLKGLILAQNERWRRGLGMQVVRFL
jgi:hypothetical protein